MRRGELRVELASERRGRRRVALLAAVLVGLAPGCSRLDVPESATNASARPTPARAASAPGPRTPAPCPAVAGAPAVVTRFRDPSGACLRPGQALVYRCSTSAAVPVAVVDGRRYLGGPHARAVLSDPAARLLGRADDGTELRIDPAIPGGVLVSTLIGAERWPAVPAQVTLAGAPVEGAARPAVFVVGDSVILGAGGPLAAAFADWSFTMDAVVSRPTSVGIDVLRARHAEVADIVVVGLGYNDGGDVAGWAATAGRLLDELAAVPLVLWVNLKGARPYYLEDNAVLAQLASTRSNVRIADWDLASTAVPPEEFASDGLHLRPAAAQAMADLVSGAVRSWYASHPDQGDQSCRPAIDAAVAAGG